MVNVRADGIAVVLGPLLRDARIVAAALVDVDSGMVLDAWSAAGEAPPRPPDLELLGAQHAEIVRSALALLADLARGRRSARHLRGRPRRGRRRAGTCCARCPTRTATGSRWPSS